MKRLFDLLVVVLSAPVWLPVLALAAALVRLCDGAPVLFRQERAGLFGRPFAMAKLRTMRCGAGSDAERTTRLGRFLRAASIDELPQLFHVLSGKMSLVGPRPLPTRYLPRYAPWQARRHETRPGITGWAQVNGRNALSWDEKFRLDVWYVDHRSLALDVRILAMTVVRAARGDGISHPGSDTMDEFLGSAAEQTVV
ncbi:MAG: sugar transferase [Kiritimatiellae bacterium]|nr:sugar transferase [Kiritimatiellia bacterium]